jgi:hypothetical protein
MADHDIFITSELQVEDFSPLVVIEIGNSEYVTNEPFPYINIVSHASNNPELVRPKVVFPIGIHPTSRPV